MIETASWARRVLALVVDWLTCYFVVLFAIGTGLIESDPFAIFTMALFILESTVLTATLGGSFGKLMTRLRVVPVDGSRATIDLLHSLLRVVLVALVIPPLVFKPDGRGLHDLVAGSATVTLQTAQGSSPPKVT